MVSHQDRGIRLDIAQQLIEVPPCVFRLISTIIDYRLRPILDTGIDDGVGSLDNVEFAFDDPMIVGFALSGNLHDNKLVKATGTVVDILINGANALAVQPAGKLVTQWAHLKSR